MRRLCLLWCLVSLVVGCGKPKPVVTPPEPPKAAARPVGAVTSLIYNPRILQFDSPDHATLVGSYKVEIWLQAADPIVGQPIQTSVLAKDKVVASGLTAPEPQLQANLLDVTPLFGVPVGQTYVIRMVAVGLDDTLVSPRSNATGPFEIAGAPRSVVNPSIK